MRLFFFLFRVCVRAWVRAPVETIHRRYLSPSLFTLFFKTGSLTEYGAPWFSILADQQASRASCLYLPNVGIAGVHLGTWDLHSDLSNPMETSQESYRNTGREEVFSLWYATDLPCWRGTWSRWIPKYIQLSVIGLDYCGQPSSLHPNFLFGNFSGFHFLVL